MDEIIRQACEAYMLENWKLFRELVSKLDEAGKRRLMKALYIP